MSLYLHPWEFDPEQPRVPASAFQRFRHYLNLDRTLPRLERLLSRFHFGSLRQVLEGRGYDIGRLQSAENPGSAPPG